VSRTYANLECEIRDRVAYLTIDRPQALNAIDRETLGEIGAALDRLAADPAVRVVVVRGRGNRAFAAGADIGELSGLGEAAAQALALEGQRVFDRIESFPKPVIAALNGFALVAGCVLAMACTLRVASDSAVLGQTEVRLGLFPGYGGTQRLPRLVGRGRALDLLVTGRHLAAEEAWRIGLVDRVVAAGDLDQEVRDLADGIARNAPLAVAACLEAVERGLSRDQAAGLEIEARLFGKCFGTSDMKEGTRAFLEKREATFKGE
jgi:enoyl-CoA hydratase